MTLLLLVTLLARQLQTVYDAIIIGAGASGVGASVALSQKNVNHIIIEARNRFGGRTHDTIVAGVTVDLGASFVHSPETSNAIDTYVKKLNWGSTLADFNSLETLYQTTATPLSDADKISSKSIVSQYQTYLSNQVSSGIDIDLSTAWQNYKTSVASKGYSTAALARAKFSLYLQANLNGGDLNTISGIAYSSQSGKNSKDYLPQTSYAALIQAIYKNYCKNAPITYNQVVTNIDYSASVVKITTSGGSVFYAKKVINTIPLGVLQSGAVTFTPNLPAAYQTAISSIGMGIFNKVIVTLDGSFWQGANTRVVDLVVPADQTVQFPQFYVTPSNPKVLLFFVSGNASKNINSGKNDSQIIEYLKTIIAKYTSLNLNITNYSITRWQTDPYSKGSYSYYKVGTTAAHFKTLMTNINNKLWFAGEHVHDTQASNVHGAFQSGLWAGQGVASSSWQAWRVLSIVCMCLLSLI